MTLKFTDADWLAMERELCGRHMADFVHQAWPVIEPGQPYLEGWHIPAVCEHLEAITDEELNRLLINVPPGTMKSLMVGVFWPAWEWGPRGLAHKRVIGASHEESLAIRDNMKMRRLVTSDWFQERWPTPFVGDQNQKTYFENHKAGWRQCCAVKSMTGKRGDTVIWDDPHSVEDSYSDKALETATRVFRETLPTRLNNPDRSAIVVVMQRLSERDVAGLILSEDFGYEHLCLPMEFEPSRRKTTSIGFVDPRTEEGELLFPERFSREVVDRDKRIMGSYAVAGQFQQRPSPLGGGIIKSQWFKRYTVTPKIVWRKIYADTANKTKEHNDYSVFAEWGFSNDGNAYLLDMIRGKWEAPELVRTAVDFWNKRKAITGLGVLRGMQVEDAQSGTGLIQSIQRKGSIPVVGVIRDRDKLTRAMDTTPHLESGHAYIPDEAPWVSDFLAECEAFTADDSHAHDDQLDPMFDAIADMYNGKGAMRIDKSLLRKI